MQYNKLDLAHAAARRLVAQYGGSAAVVETSDLPGVYTVGTLPAIRQLASKVKVTTCRLFYGITDRKHQIRRTKAGLESVEPCVLEMDTALLCDRGE